MQSCAEMSGVRGFSFLYGDRTADVRSHFRDDDLSSKQADRVQGAVALLVDWGTGCALIAARHF